MLFFHQPTLYVRFFINRIEIRDLDTGRVIDRNSSTPFSSERLLLADFFTAECFLRELVKELYPTYFYLLLLLKWSYNLWKRRKVVCRR
jgi:hypothetical protein